MKRIELSKSCMEKRNGLLVLLLANNASLFQLVQRVANDALGGAA